MGPVMGIAFLATASLAWADGSQFEGPFVADNPDGDGKFVGWR
ncbi:MAG TPA: hypothetical protein VGA50_04270 [Kiloniellales bacterium]